MAYVITITNKQWKVIKNNKEKIKLSKKVIFLFIFNGFIVLTCEKNIEKNPV